MSPFDWEVYEGSRIEDALPKSTVASVALVHIDMNFFEPEVFGLRTLWDRIPRGGVILLDDYAFQSHDKQYDAMNKLAAELGFAILSTPTGQGIIIK
jgi:O-methyltransferase